MAILYPGLHNDAVKKRHVRWAQTLVDAGFSFDLLVDKGREETAALIREALDTPGGQPDSTGARSDTPGAQPDSAAPTGFALEPQDTGLVVRDASGTLAGALVLTAVSYDNGTALFVRALATAPGFRSRGIATVLLGLAPQVLGQAGLPTRALLTGAAPEALAGFVHRAGFVVLENGDEPPFTFGGIEDELLASSATIPGDRCWFFKEVA
ncbi:GNAT family N-acetyltransferase [Brevibacterium pityocampae]